MGRSFWLTDEPEVAADWLARATALNPNYAQGFYASAFTEMLTGNAPATFAALDTSLHLSPLDPLLYGIHGVRAQMLIQQEDHEAAARLGRPRGHHARGALSDRHDRARRERAGRPPRSGRPLAPEGPSAQARRHRGGLFRRLPDARRGVPRAHRGRTASARLLIRPRQCRTHQLLAHHADANAAARRPAKGERPHRRCHRACSAAKARRDHLAHPRGAGGGQEPRDAAGQSQTAQRRSGGLAGALWRSGRRSRPMPTDMRGTSRRWWRTSASASRSSLAGIAAELNARGMLTRRGGRCHVSTVLNLFDRLGEQRSFGR